ncbi:MAG: carboxypeptidase M32 [Alphaproteobacteria bacterium]
MGAAYRELERRFARLSRLEAVAGLLSWDSHTMMPAGGAAARAEQIATLEGVRHDLLADAAVGELIDRAKSEADGLDPWEIANLAEMGRRWRHASAVDKTLVEALARATTASEMRWRRAKEEDDFAGLVPALKEVLDLVRDVAERKAQVFGCAPYDALLDAYEPGARAADIDPLFDDLAAFLTGLLPEVLDRERRRGPPLPLDGPFPVAAQRALCVCLMKALGFDFDHGRLDVSRHPFCGGTPEDVRITTRYREDDALQAVMAVLHETGHALYDRGLPARWRHQPVGGARSMSVHESQSLLIEMQACRSLEFMTFAAPLMREAFSRAGPAWEPENLFRLYTQVKPGPIRVDADEVTYPAHILLRYRLEQALIANKVEVDDLPAAWREGMMDLLGLAPKDDREGCLQDIHWAEGEFGYFPTYTLGALIAAQLFAAATRDEPGLLAAIADGDFAPLRAWLARHVHGLASSLSTVEIVRGATGQPLGTEAFKAHLKARYLG